MDIDVDPFDERGKTDEATGGEDETIPLIPPPPGTQIDPNERYSPFRGAKPEFRLMREQVENLYKVLSQHYKRAEGLEEVFHYDLFVPHEGELYLNDKDVALTAGGKLRTFKSLVRELGQKRLEKLGFDITKRKVTPQEAAMLNKTEEELPTASAIDRANDIEMQELTAKASKSAKDLINEISSDRGTQTDDLFKQPLRELLGLDKELKTIRGSLQVEVAKKVKLEQHIARDKAKLAEMENDPGYDDAMRDNTRNRLERLNEELSTRQESIDLLKGRLTNQITSFKETIAKVLNKDASLGERIRTLFREQGITIFSILTAIGMAIGVLVEALVPGSTAQQSASHGAGDTPGSAKEWVRNKLRALASLLGKLAEKAGSALPGIIGSVVAWLLNRAKEVVGWISKNLWSLVLLCVWMVYDYMKKDDTKKK